jgi:branched-chain amino acid transport system substrate-binding protein
MLLIASLSTAIALGPALSANSATKTTKAKAKTTKKAATATPAAPATAAPQKTGTVTIGVSAPITGVFASPGDPFSNGVKFAADEINNAGGFAVGDTTYKFKVNVVDDRSQQAPAIQNATQFIRDDKAIAIFGPIGPLGPAVADLTKGQNVLNFSSASAVAAIAGPPAYPNVFITIAAVEKRIDSSVGSIVKFLPRARRVAIIAPNDETTRGILAPLQDAFHNASISSSDYLYPVGTTDLSTVLTRVASDKPDIIFSGWSPTDQKTQSTQFDAAGIAKATPIFFYAGTIDQCKTFTPGRPCIAHPLAGNDLTAGTENAATKTFIANYLKYTSTKALPERTAPILWTYDFVYLLADAMKKAGTVTDANKLADTLRGGLTRDNALVGKLFYNGKNNPVFGFDVSLVGADGSVTTAHFG